MRIKTRLMLSITLLLVVSMLSLGYGILFVQRTRERQDMDKAAKIIENSVQRVALDAILQKDDLQLVSYVNFLKAQYPALSYARITWYTGERSRSVNLGDPPASGRVVERSLEVADPSELSRRVGIRLGISQDVIESAIRENQRRLKKIVISIWLATSFLWLAVAYWLSWSITAPIASLGRVASEIGSGKLGRRLEWQSQDEIGDLVQAFNHMSERLAELDEAKRNFISSVTHEFRSPLGAIESFIGLINSKDAGHLECRDHREYLNRIQANVRRLGQFVNDLLDVSKIEKGKMECVLKPVDIHGAMLDVCKFFEAKAQTQEVRLLNSVEHIPLVMADVGRIRQVLVNLISNALKFTPKGGQIEISVDQFRENGVRWLEISVRDTGRGIDGRDLQRLFQAFSQGRNVTDGVYGTSKGTGLGLYICKSIIDQHGGKISVESAPGKGTRVSFSLRLTGLGAESHIVS
ncbi:MAG: HAMP domain-containing sensor histidine kinase [Elusimicrobiota bacterium]|jgi:signal transduction histidine kinase